MRTFVVRTLVVVTCALVLAGCGESSASKFVDQQEARNPSLIEQSCVEINAAEQIGGLLSYYNGFASQYEKTVSGTNAPRARDVFREIRQRCDNPTG